jgi:hypothetical protein
MIFASTATPVLRCAGEEEDKFGSVESRVVKLNSVVEDIPA